MNVEALLFILGVVFLVCLLLEYGRRPDGGSDFRRPRKARFPRTSHTSLNQRSRNDGKRGRQSKRGFGASLFFRDRSRNQRHSRRKSGE